MLSLDPFQPDVFELNQLVEGLVKPIKFTSQDLLPLISGVEGQVSDCHRLEGGCEQEIDRLKVHLSERGELGQRHAQLNHKLRMVREAQERFDSKLDLDNGLYRIQLGHQLERWRGEQGRAHEAHQVLSLLIELEAGGGAPARFEKLQQSLYGAEEEARLKGACLLRRLLKVTSNSEGWVKAAERVRRLAERFENDLLAAFHGAFEGADLQAMRSAASLLTAFNGGASCVQSFVGQHAFFTAPLDPTRLHGRYHQATMTDERLPIDLSLVEEVDPLLATLFRQVLATVQADWRYLRTVFADPAPVIQALLERLFQEPIQVHLEAVLADAKAHSNIALLRCLAASHCACLELVDQLLQVGRTVAGDTLPPSNTRLAAINAEHLHALAKALFSPWLDGPKYLKREVEALSEAASISAAPLLVGLAMRKPAGSKRAILLASLGANSGVGRADAASQLLAGAGWMRWKGAAWVDPLEGANGIPSVEQVQRILQLHADAVQRIKSLHAAEDQDAMIQEMGKTLVTSIIDRYFEPAIER